MINLEFVLGGQIIPNFEVDVVSIKTELTPGYVTELGIRAKHVSLNFWRIGQLVCNVNFLEINLIGQSFVLQDLEVEQRGDIDSYDINAKFIVKFWQNTDMMSLYNCKPLFLPKTTSIDALSTILTEYSVDHSINNLSFSDHQDWNFQANESFFDRITKISYRSNNNLGSVIWYIDIDGGVKGVNINNVLNNSQNKIVDITKDSRILSSNPETYSLLGLRSDKLYYCNYYSREFIDKDVFGSTVVHWDQSGNVFGFKSSPISSELNTLSSNRSNVKSSGVTHFDNGVFANNLATIDSVMKYKKHRYIEIATSILSPIKPGVILRLLDGTGVNEQIMLVTSVLIVDQLPNGHTLIGGIKLN